MNNNNYKKNLNKYDNKLIDIKINNYNEIIDLEKFIKSGDYLKKQDEE